MDSFLTQSFIDLNHGSVWRPLTDFWLFYLTFCFLSLSYKQKSLQVIFLDVLNLAMLFQVVLKVNLLVSHVWLGWYRKLREKFIPVDAIEISNCLGIYFLIKKFCWRVKKLDGKLMTVYCPIQIDVQSMLILTVPITWFHKTINCRTEHALLYPFFVFIMSYFHFKIYCYDY